MQFSKLLLFYPKKKNQCNVMLSVVSHEIEHVSNTLKKKYLKSKTLLSTHKSHSNLFSNMKRKDKQ